MQKLTALAAATPTYDAWQEATRLLDAMGDAAQAEAVRAFEGASPHWPTGLDPWTGFSLDAGLELRRSPPHWVKEVYAGQHAPKHALVRILESPRRPMGAQKLENLLSEGARLENLQQVGFDQAKITGAFLKALKDDGPWRRWKALRLWTCGLNASALKALGVAGLSSLEQLNLEQNRLGEAGLKGLAKAPGLPALTGLHLGANDLDASAAQALAATDWFGRLTWLNLASNKLYDVGMAQLTASGLPALRTLDLSLNQVGQSTAAWAAGLPAVETLRLGNTNATDEGVEALVERLPALRELHLDATGVGDRGALAIAASGHPWRALALRSTAITGEGLGAILRSPAAAEIERLELGSGFTLANARLLVDGACPKLKFLWWHGPELGEGVEAALRANPRLAATLPY